jgi:hypothetical protein
VTDGAALQSGSARWGTFMKQRRKFWLALIISVALYFVVTPSRAITGDVRIVFTKAGLVVGAGGGRGVLTFRGRDYQFTAQGLSVGLTVGASVSNLIGRASHLHRLSDFEGTYTVVGAGGALLGGAGGVRLRNPRGVVLSLQGAKAGVEFSANVSKVVITLD